MKYITLAVASAATSTAAVIDKSSVTLVPRDSVSELANFDDLDASQLNLPIPIPYAGLNFSNLALDNPAAYNSQPIITPQSAPYYATASGSTPAYISIEGTDTQSFDLDSFYFGCFDSRELEPTSCSFTVTGLSNSGLGRHGGDQGPLFFTYTPDAEFKGASAMEVSLGWTALDAFFVTVIADDAAAVRTVQVIDSVQYTINN